MASFISPSTLTALHQSNHRPFLHPRRLKRLKNRFPHTPFTCKARIDDTSDDFASVSDQSLISNTPNPVPSDPVSSKSVSSAIVSEKDTNAPTDLPADDHNPENNSSSITDETEQACQTDFMWSPTLQEYQERKEAGLISSNFYQYKQQWRDVWNVSVGDSKALELRNQYSRVGILIEANFNDFQPSPGCTDAYNNATLEEISRFKARTIYDVTAMPVIAETHDYSIDAPESGSRINKTLQQGYYTREDDQVDPMIDRVRPISDENRITHFNSCVVYFDGETEILKHRKVEAAIFFSAQRYMTIAIASALGELYKEHTSRLGLKLDSWESGNNGMENEDEAQEGTVLVGATLLKERILRDGKMLDEGIIKVSSFLNHMVDADLMESCGEELAERLRHTMPNKILTVESTGLIAGLPTARKLGIPLVFARKSRPITISDSYQTTYRSATKGTTNELIVSCEYLETGDRVIIIDDFLAGGSTAEALFKLARMAHAKVVGVGVLIEKMSDGGRAFLSGYDVPVESLAKILPHSDQGRISFVDEGPWVRPDVAKRAREAAKEEAMKANAKYFNEAGPIVGEDEYRRIQSEDVDVDEAEVEVMKWEEDEDILQELDDIEDGLIQDVGKA